MIEQANRRLVADRAVWPNLIVVSTPSLHLFAGVFKAHEPMGIQTLGSELAIDGVDGPHTGWAWRRV